MDPVVGIMGLGAWGTALGNHLALNGINVVGWSRDGKFLKSLDAARENKKYLPNIALASRWTFSDSLVDVFACKYVVCTVPARYTQAAFKDPGFSAYKGTLISGIKGFVPNDGTPSALFSRLFPGAACVILSGPSFAADLAQGKPVSVVSASYNAQKAFEVARMFGQGRMRVYTSSDVIGVEWGGILKNIIAIAAGVADGCGWGDSTRAALITRGLSEITRFAVSKGAQIETLSGLSGLGDLLMTATCNQSRNRTFGLEIGRGNPGQLVHDSSLTVEGLASLPLVVQEAEQNSIEIPLILALDAIIRGKISPQDAMELLMSRPIKNE
jgi:glycerol-3-phosphate dehydrogenase (NAD(P)+)